MPNSVEKPSDSLKEDVRETVTTFLKGLLEDPEVKKRVDEIVDFVYGKVSRVADFAAERNTGFNLETVSNSQLQEYAFNNPYLVERLLVLFREYQEKYNGHDCSLAEFQTSATRSGVPVWKHFLKILELGIVPGTVIKRPNADHQTMTVDYVTSSARLRFTESNVTVDPRHTVVVSQPKKAVVKKTGRKRGASRVIRG